MIRSRLGLERNRKLALAFLSIVPVLLMACSQTARQTDPTHTIMTSNLETTTTIDPSATQIPSVPTFTAGIEETPKPTKHINQANCNIGIGLREETVAILLESLDYQGLVMTGSVKMAEDYFSSLKDWKRVIGAPSHDSIMTKAQRSENSEIPYEALAYGLETNKTTPNEEWQNLIASTETFQVIANQFGKQTLVGPGFQLMARNEDLYPSMARYADIWMIQTQQLQKEPPGLEYRQGVEKIVELLKSGNPNIVIWAQITLPPDREPDSKEWLAYHQTISDLVDGVYIGVYIWDLYPTERIKTEIKTIFHHVCDFTG